MPCYVDTKLDSQCCHEPHLCLLLLAHCFSPSLGLHLSLLRCEQCYGLQAAQRRLDSADVMLKGPEGVMKYRPLHAHLVGRRCRMATMLGQVYAIGPQTGIHQIAPHCTTLLHVAPHCTI